MFSDQIPFIIQVLALGLAQGAIYALIALGYTMVYGIIELINFAHGDVFMIGTFVTIIVFTLLGATSTINNNWPLLIGVLLITALVAMVFCGLLGVVIERVAYRPLRHAPRLAPLITAIGISLILEDLAKLRFGSSFVGVPSVFPNVTFQIGGVTISWLNVITFTVAIVLMIALQILISRTRTGRAMRSVAQDRDAASLMGVDVDRTIVITFFLGGALAGAAGLIWGLEIKQTVFYVGFQVGLIAFTAAVLGGIGNIVGAMLGGLIIGLIPATIQILDFYFPGYQLTRWNEAAIFAVLILILIFRPTGLLGQQTPDKV
jgi:branched-chain amino acid transport system permease protein